MSLKANSPLEAAIAASLSSRSLASLSADARNEALTAVHDAMRRDREGILQANARDLEAASKLAAEGSLSQSVLKRLDLGRPGKYDDMLKGILDVHQLEDPVGKTTLRTELDDDLELTRVTCPIGVLLIIFEARPEVIANIAALAIKSGNAAIMKGGKESTESFQAIASIISKTLDTTKVPSAAIQLVRTRDVIDQLLDLDRYIDLVIPRGSNELVRYIKDHTKIPVLGHADGLCSVYLHLDADKESAVKVICDAKCGYPAACNAIETLLVHEDALTSILPAVAEALLSRGVSLRCDQKSISALSSSMPPSSVALLQPATEVDFETEFLDLILAVKTIPAASSSAAAAATAAFSTSLHHDDPIQLAIAHINAHSSHHTDAILTSSTETAETFLAGVDSAGVYWNTSTRMADGMRYGFGAEVGISTNKIHSRGPVGLEGLTIYKYLIRGKGQVAADYGDGKKVWKHRQMAV